MLGLRVEVDVLEAKVAAQGRAMGRSPEGRAQQTNKEHRGDVKSCATTRASTVS